MTEDRAVEVVQQKDAIIADLRRDLAEARAAYQRELATFEPVLAVARQERDEARADRDAALEVVEIMRDLFGNLAAIGEATDA